MEKPLKKKLTAVFAVVLALVIVGLIISDMMIGTRKFEKSTTLMNTVVSVNIEGKKSEETGENVLKAIANLETKSLSRHIASTAVSELNENAGKFLETDEMMLKLSQRCTDVFKKSNGAFNPLLGRISDMWGFGTENAKVPNSKDLDSALRAVKGKELKIRDNKVLVPEGTVLDFGAVGKGVACDEAKKVLQKSDTKRAVISVGGSLLLYGEGEKFNVGVRNPLGEGTDVLGTLKLSDICVSTSGSYERYFEENGKTYHHILNPENGYPTENDLLSVTVVSKDGFLSDALSTACFVLGYDEAIKLLKEYDAQALFVFKDKSLKITDGIKDSFTVSDESFRLI